MNSCPNSIETTVAKPKPLPSHDFGDPICYLSRSGLILCADCAEDFRPEVKPFLLDGMDPDLPEVCSRCGEEF